MVTITDNTIPELLLDDGQFRQETFTAAGANTYPVGLLLARNTSTSKLVVFVNGGATGTGTPLAILTRELITTGAGDTVLRVLRSGELREDRLLVWTGGSPVVPTTLELDLLQDFNIRTQPDRELLRFDNS